MIPGHHHQGLQPDFSDLAGLKFGQQVVKAARAFHRGHEDQRVAFLKQGPRALKNQIRPSVGLTVGHERHGLVPPAFVHARQHGPGNALGVLTRFQQGAPQIDGLKTAGMLLQVKQRRPLQLCEVFAGHHVQGLHAHQLHAAPG